MLKGIFTVLLGFALFLPQAQAAGFPTKPVQLVIPYAPGGGSDITARIIADAMKDILPQPVVVSNMPGAGGLTGTSFVLNARPDGYTILWEHPTLALTPAISNMPFRWSSFDLLCAGAGGDMVMVVGKNSSWKSAGDIFGAIKASPGKIRVALPVNGLQHVLFLDMINKLGGGMKFLAVHGSGDKPRLTSLMGDNCDVTLCALGPAMPYIQSGDIKPVALISEKRNPLLPNTPTLKEAGIDVAYEYYYTVFLPKGVPDQVKKTLYDAFEKASKKPEVKEQLTKLVFNPEFVDTGKGKKIWQAYADRFEAIIKQENLNQPQK